MRQGTGIGISMLAVLLAGMGARADEGDRFLDAARRFADVTLEHGRDTYGTEHTPMFVDGLHAESLEPAVWKGTGGEDWILANFASCQSLLRLLDGLTALTRDARYRTAAEDAARYALDHCRAPSGLFYWGGHAAWDALGERPVGQGDPPVHELKGHEPYYQIMARVNPAAAKDILARIWAAHILDWELLDYNRHGTLAGKVTVDWSHAFKEDVPVPYPAKGNNLSFVNVVPPLLHGGTMLAVLFDDKDALTWSRRLAYRCQQMRHPVTGLSGGQLSYREYDRAKEALGHVHPDINEAQIVATYHQTSRYHSLPLAQMQAGEALRAKGGAWAKTGEEYIMWAAEDLEVYARNCWDEENHVFTAKMIDGTPLNWRESKTGYYVPESFAPAKPDGNVFWGYSLAHRLRQTGAHWAMARELGKVFGLGDLGTPDGTGRALNLNTNNKDFDVIYGLLELHEATHAEPLLQLAARIGDNLIEWQAASGLFPRPGREYARTGDDIPLALLHLAGARTGKRGVLPAAAFDRRFFHCVYHGPLEEYQKKRADERTMDAYVFYGN